MMQINDGRVAGQQIRNDARRVEKVDKREDIPAAGGKGGMGIVAMLKNLTGDGVRGGYI